MPIVIAANKNDLPCGMNEDEIRDGLSIGKDVPIFFIASNRREEIRFVLESLVDSITLFSY